MKLQSTLEGRSHRAWVPVMAWEPQGRARGWVSLIGHILRVAFLFRETGRMIQGTRWTEALASSEDNQTMASSELRGEMDRR